jgi:hypothetical protein
MRIRNIKADWDGVMWGGPDADWYYVYWFCRMQTAPDKRWGFDGTYYDGPHRWLACWFFRIAWSTPWTSCAGLI